MAASALALALGSLLVLSLRIGNGCDMESVSVQRPFLQFPGLLWHARWHGQLTGTVYVYLGEAGRIPPNAFPARTGCDGNVIYLGMYGLCDDGHTLL
jgi:hypothetical protein